METVKYLLLTQISLIVNAIKAFINDNVITKIPGVASKTKAGIIKPGTGLSVDTEGNVNVVLEGIEVDPGNIAKATDSGYGVVKVGEGINVADGVISVNAYTKSEADAKFQTEAQVTAIAESKAAAKVAEIVDGAPESLDTLKEIADTLNKDTEGGVVNAIMTEIGKKANADETYTKTAADETFIKASDFVAATDAEVEAALTAAFAAA